MKESAAERKQLIILVRHGQYGYNGRLDDKGRATIFALIDQLKTIIGEQSVAIITSAAEWAKQSAALIAQTFGLLLDYQHEGFQALWVYNDHMESFPRAKELVKEHQDKADILIVVTHKEYAEELPCFYAWTEWNASFSVFKVSYGEAIVIDRKNKTVSPLEKYLSPPAPIVEEVVTVMEKPAEYDEELAF